MSLSRWNPPANGRLTEAALRRKLERLDYSVTRYVYPPGTCFPDHSHSVDKMDAIVSGRFKMVMGGKQVILEAGDILAVPRGTGHLTEVVGDEPVVSLDGVQV